MWHTSCGNRTLHGAEARLFANALLCLLDEAVADQFEDCDLDLSCFAHHDSSLTLQRPAREHMHKGGSGA
jgi:hypothetical protein